MVVKSVREGSPVFCTGIELDDILVGYSYRNRIRGIVNCSVLDKKSIMQLPPFVTALDGSVYAIHVYRPSKKYAAVLTLVYGGEPREFPEKKLGIGLIEKPVLEDKHKIKDLSNDDISKVIQVVVAYVDIGLPADKLGFKVGDILETFEVLEPGMLGGEDVRIFTNMDVMPKALSYVKKLYQALILRDGEKAKAPYLQILLTRGDEKKKIVINIKDL